MLSKDSLRRVDCHAHHCFISSWHQNDSKGSAELICHPRRPSLVKFWSLVLKAINLFLTGRDFFFYPRTIKPIFMSSWSCFENRAFCYLSFWPLWWYSRMHFLFQRRLLPVASPQDSRQGCSRLTTLSTGKFYVVSDLPLHRENTCIEGVCPNVLRTWCLWCEILTRRIVLNPRV